MSQNKSILLILLTNCLLLGLVHGLIGQNVQSIRSGNYTFIVSISRKFGTHTPGEFFKHHFCTGSLISHKSVLTAAHCLSDKEPNHVEIIAGSTNLSKGGNYDIESWTTFDQWNHHRRTTHPSNNIAIVKLKGEGITNIHPVLVLPVDNEYLVDKEIRVMGWGITETGRQPLGLRGAYLKVVSNDECSNQGTMLKGEKFTVPSNYFCSRAQPWVLSSNGDGGAPVLNRQRRVVGINIGVCPKVDGYPVEMLNQLQLNSHLNLIYYRDFISQVAL